jgi:hypothetical protein
MDEIWDDFRVEPERFLGAGDQVPVFVQTSGTGKQSGAAVVITAAHLYTLRDGRGAVPLLRPGLVGPPSAQRCRDGAYGRYPSMRPSGASSFVAARCSDRGMEER